MRVPPTSLSYTRDKNTVFDARDVRRGAAHVEAHGASVPPAARATAARASAPPAGPDSTEAAPRKRPRSHKPAARLHQQQPRAGQLGGQPLEVALQERRQVGVERDGAGARQVTDGRRNLVPGGYVAKPAARASSAISASRTPCPVVVQDRDAEAVDAALDAAPRAPAELFAVRALQHVAVGVESRVHLEHASPAAGRGF